MSHIKNISYRVKDQEQVSRLDALSYFYGKSLQDIIDEAVTEYYLKCVKEDSRLETVKKLQNANKLEKK